MEEETEHVANAAPKDAGELHGRVALITGATGGIGRAIAAALAAGGARLALTGRREPGDVVDLLSGLPGSADVTYHPCDVRDPVAIAAVVKAVFGHHGGLHILVNNAGVALDALILRTRQEVWEESLAVNLSAAFHFSKQATRHLLAAQGAGRVINISSVVAERGNAGQSAYAAAKAGLLGLTRALARELASRQVTVNAVAPGYIDTKMIAPLLASEAWEPIAEEIPLGRVGQPEDVASAVRFLAGPQAGYITGEVLRVNGGLYM